MRNPYKFPFHGLLESVELRIHEALPRSPTSPRYKTPLGSTAYLRRPIRKRLKSVLALPHVSSWRRNINLLPFPHFRLRYGLGSANCQLMTIAGKPAPFRRTGFSPVCCCYFWQDVQSYGVHTSLRPCFHPRRTPLY